MYSGGMDSCTGTQQGLREPDGRGHANVFCSPYEPETLQESRMRKSSFVRFAGINFGDIARRVIIEEIKKIQQENLKKKNQK